MSGRAHTDAIAAMLTAAGLRVYPGGAPDNPTMPYVALYCDGGRALQTSLARDFDQSDVTFQTTAVGTTHAQAMWASEKVQAAVAGKRVTVSGFANSPTEQLMSSPVAVDYDAPTNVRYKFDQWRYRAVPST